MKKALKIFLLVFIFSFSISFNIDARTTFGEGIYRVDENLSSIDLVHGAKFTQDIGYADVVDNENLRYKQLVSVLETPTGEDIKVVTWALTSSFKWTMSTVPAIARDYEKNHPGYRVIAGVNGDFFDIDGGENLPYATEGAHVSDGDVYKKTSNTAVGITNDGSNDPLMGNSKVTFNDKMTLAIYNDANELIYEFAVDKVNQDVLENEIGLYYANWNNEKKIEPITSPVGYVIENAEYAIAYSQADFYGRGIITGLKSKELNSGEFSIVSKNDQVNSILKTGVKVRVQYDLSEDWENVESITGVRNTLIYDGVNIIDKDTARHPRTMIGRKADGTLMLVVADGRAPEVRDGLTHQDMPTVMHHYGAVEAYNLDGGGSSTMVVLQNGELVTVNKPSGTTLRPVSNAVLIVVRIPEIEYSFERFNNQINVNAKIINNNGLEADKLYIGINEEIKELLDGRVNFTGLDANKIYFYDFYRKVGDKFESLTIQGQIMTSKIKPILEYTKIYYDDNDLVIEVRFNDSNITIERKSVEIDGKNVIFKTSDIARFDDFEGDISTLALKIEINLNDGHGRQPIFFDLNLRPNVDVLFELASSKIDNKIKSIYN